MDIKEAIQALESNTKSRVVELRGEKGEKGDRGEVGPPGHDGKDVTLVIGKVVGGDEAVARIHQEGGTFILDLCLPRGEQGQRGLQGLSGKNGEQGIPGLKGDRGDRGPDGSKGERGIDGLNGLVGERGPQGQRGEQGIAGPRGETGARGERGIEGKKGERGIEGERGPVGNTGERGESIQGPSGQNAYPTDEMVESIMIRVMTNIIGNDIVLQKMAAVKAELKRSLHQATSRHQAELAEVYRKVDNIIG